MKAVMKLALGIPIALLAWWTCSSQAYSIYGTWGLRSVIYDYHTLSSDWKTSASYGSSRWNGISGSGFEWAPSNTTSNTNDIYTGYIDGAGTIFGATTSNLGASSGSFTWINIKFDTSETWYFGTGSPAANELDARSVAAHEFGHALGLYHTNVPCNGAESSRPTMCPSYTVGKTYFRTLQQDDRDGVVAIYALPFGEGFESRSEETSYPAVNLLYQSVSLEENITSAPAVARGVISDISPTQWNQDSGKYWHEQSKDKGTLFTALPLFRIKVDINEVLRDTIGVGRDIELTVIGEGPDRNREFNSNLAVGKEIVVFFRSTQLIWRDGTRPILQPVGVPEEAILIGQESSIFHPANDLTAGIDIKRLKRAVEEADHR